MRSKLSAITARTPSSSGPFAAQSRDEPAPYSLPAMMITGVPSLAILHRRVVDRHLLAARESCFVNPPSMCGTSRLRMRVLANVPRIITSWLPRREP